MNENVKGYGTVDEILNGPDFFTCERFKTRMLKKRCVERQEDDHPLQSEEFITSEIGLSIEVCKTCEQGKRIRDEIISEKPKPQRGKGDRKESCLFYRDCLDYVDKKNWRTFKCEGCPLHRPEIGKVMVIKDKIKNTRVCKTDGCGKITFGPHCPLCPSCMAKKANEKRAAKKTEHEKNKGVIRAKKQQNETQGQLKVEKASPGDDTVLTIEFGKHGSILEAIKEIAEEEVRPLDMQIIYMLKKQLKNTKVISK